MSITGRLFGFALIGPLGAVGPTEASKRAKAQKRLLEEQNRQLRRIADVADRPGQSKTEVSSEPIARSGRYYAVADKRRGDRVAWAGSEWTATEAGVAVVPGDEGTVIDLQTGRLGWFGRGREEVGVRVAWEGGAEPRWTGPEHLTLVAKATELPPPPVVSERN